MSVKDPWLKRILIVIVWTSILYVGYQITNQHQYFETRTLPLTPIDNAIPFLVWTVIPYFILIGGMYLPIFIEDEKYFFQSLMALTIAVLINYSIFLFWPTVIVRPPIPEGATISEFLYRWLMSIDGPANCFPSGHITSPGIGVWFLTKDKPQRKKIYYPLYALFALSVLTTKQHYVWDILGGLATMGIGIYLASKFNLHRFFYSEK